MAAIETTQQLRAMYLQPKERAVKKQWPKLDQHCKNFLALVRFAVLSTCDKDGNMDASPRGGEAGFVKAVDDHTVIIPDWTGNNRLDTFTNIVETGRAGAIFLVPGVDEALLAEWKISKPSAVKDSEAVMKAARKAWRWVAEMEEISAFVSEDPAGAKLFEATADLYRRLAADVAGAKSETEMLARFFR